MTVLYLKIYILFSLFYSVARCWFGVLLLVNSVLLLNVLYPDIVYCYVTLIVRIASIEKQKVRVLQNKNKYIDGYIPGLVFVLNMHAMWTYSLIYKLAIREQHSRQSHATSGHRFIHNVDVICW